MTSKFLICFLGVVVLFNCLHTGASLKCYVCDKSHSGCNDPADNKTISNYERNCSANAKGCVKVLQPELEDVYLRTCGVEEDCDVYNECYFCGDELCNSSSDVLPSLVLIGGVISGFVLKYM